MIHSTAGIQVVTFRKAYALWIMGPSVVPAMPCGLWVDEILRQGIKIARAPKIGFGLPYGDHICSCPTDGEICKINNLYVSYPAKAVESPIIAWRSAETPYYWGRPGYSNGNVRDRGSVIV